MKLIAVGRNLFAMVDDEDYPMLSRFRWFRRVQDRTTYASCWIGNVSVSMHRLILGCNGYRIDHIDGDGLNNRKKNLRPCTHRQNSWNRKIQKHSSGFKGVTKIGASRWSASIRVNGKKRHLGTFSIETEAAIAYDNAAMANFGRFARTNQMEGVI